LTDWARQSLLLLARWLPDRQVVTVVDSSYAAIDLLSAMGRHLTMITPLRFDARLFVPPPLRLPSTKGRPRVSGTRQATLLQRLADPNTTCQQMTVIGWYGHSECQLDIISGQHFGITPASRCRSAGCWCVTPKRKRLPPR